MNNIPWLIIPGLIGFVVAFIIQFRLKHYVDREKVLRIQDMSELYSNGIPPKKILNDQGQRLYRWFIGGIAAFIASIVCTMIWGLTKR
jgi:phosphate/sulfate permease